MTNEFAIKVLTELRGYGDKFANIGFDRKEALDIAIKALEQQPKKGKWLTNPLADYAGEGYFICSKCENDVYEVSDFCPNCGADMRGE